MILLRCIAFLIANVLLLTGAGAQDKPLSGLNWATPAIRDMQQDDFANPGMFWLERGEALFRKRDGQTRNTCRSCHFKGSLDGAAARFPKVRDGRLVNLETQVNDCRAKHMVAEPWPLESEELLSMVL